MYETDKNYSIEKYTYECKKNIDIFLKLSLKEFINQLVEIIKKNLNENKHEDIAIEINNKLNQNSLRTIFIYAMSEKFIIIENDNFENNIKDCVKKFIENEENEGQIFTFLHEVSKKKDNF